MLEVLTVMTPICMLIGSYLIIKKVKNDTILDIQDYLQSEEGAKMLYSMGAMIGNGAKSGFGINTRSGKFKWQDLIGMIAAQWLQGNMPKIQESVTGLTNPTEGFKKLGQQ